MTGTVSEGSELSRKELSPLICSRLRKNTAGFRLNDADKFYRIRDRCFKRIIFHIKIERNIFFV